MYSLSKAQKLIESNERWKVTLELWKKQVCLKKPFFCNFTSKGSSRALILGKQLTYKSEWAHKRYWEKIQHNSNNPENKSPENNIFSQAHIKNEI